MQDWLERQSCPMEAPSLQSAMTGQLRQDAFGATGEILGAAKQEVE